MGYPDGAHTHGSGPVMTGGGAALVLGVIVAIADRKQIAHIADDLTVVALAVIAALMMLGIAALIFLVRHRRREAEALAAYREEQFAKWRAEVEERKARQFAAEQARALPAPQPVVQVVNVIDPALLASLLNGGQQAVRVIPASTEEVPR